MTGKVANLQNWIGRKTESTNTIFPQPSRFMQAMLDLEPSLNDGDLLPPLWHWLYFLEARKASELGRDAHPKKGGFLPAVPLPRRMWAGGRFDFHAPLILGQNLKKCSVIKNITEKQGRTGKLCFVTVEHTVSHAGQMLLREEQDIVYREDPSSDLAKSCPALAPDNPDFSQLIKPTPVMLFRYSALTFNGHRIHYDIDYARDIEGYEGLVFHGPLTATLLIDLACKNMGFSSPEKFEFKALAPLSGLHHFHIEGRCDDNTVNLWAKRHDNVLAMTATAVF